MICIGLYGITLTIIAVMINLIGIHFVNIVKVSSSSLICEGGHLVSGWSTILLESNLFTTPSISCSVQHVQFALRHMDCTNFSSLNEWPTSLNTHQFLHSDQVPSLYYLIKFLHNALHLCLTILWRSPSYASVTIFFTIA